MTPTVPLSRSIPTAVAVAASLLAVRMVATRVLIPRAHAKEREKNEILIKTPWGSFKATQTVDSSRLGLPIYPGATYLKDDDSGSASLNFSFSGQPEIRILVGKFRTPDSVEKVREFYKTGLGKDVTKFTEKDSEGNTTFEIKRKSLIKAVELKRVDGATEIKLARIEGVNEEAN